MDMHQEGSPERAPAPSGGTIAINTGELRALLCSLSHELCRPLVSLRAGFEWLLRDPVTEVAQDQRGHIQTMMALCDDLLRLTRGYLDYAGLVNGSRPPTLGMFSLGAIIAEIDRQFRPVAESHGLCWSAVAHDPQIKILTDASLCQQILGNLASNALKYTPRGGAVQVEASAGDELWTVTVIDDGPGIPSDSLERVFQPFYRLARDEHSRIEGNGLGLSICRELTERLGGSISLDSTSGVGTIVKVSFPRSPALQPAGKASLGAHEQPGDRDRPARRRRTSGSNSRRSAPRPDS
jgi:signal transduction histidine kinase